MKVLQQTFSLKSKPISYSTYSHDHTRLRIHGLFYLNLLNTNTHVCDFGIPIKTLDYQQLLILLQQLIQHRIMSFFKEYCRQMILESFKYKNPKFTIGGTRCTLLSLKTPTQSQLIMLFKNCKKWIEVWAKTVKLWAFYIC